MRTPATGTWFTPDATTSSQEGHCSPECRGGTGVFLLLYILIVKHEGAAPRPRIIPSVGRACTADEYEPIGPESSGSFSWDTDI